MFVVLFVRTVLHLFICSEKVLQHSALNSVTKRVDWFWFVLVVGGRKLGLRAMTIFGEKLFNCIFDKTVFTTLTTHLTWYKHKWFKKTFIFKKVKVHIFTEIRYHGLRSSNPLTVLKIWIIVFRFQKRTKLR